GQGTLVATQALQPRYRACSGGGARPPNHRKRYLSQRVSGVLQAPAIERAGKPPAPLAIPRMLLAHPPRPEGHGRIDAPAHNPAGGDTKHVVVEAGHDLFAAG